MDAEEHFNRHFGEPCAFDTAGPTIEEVPEREDEHMGETGDGNRGGYGNWDTGKGGGRQAGRRRRGQHVQTHWHERYAHEQRPPVRPPPQRYDERIGYQAPDWGARWDAADWWQHDNRAGGWGTGW
eukprot:2853375-Alexandrium_andersonii.AAC.1